jgi:CRISPR-associated protein Cas1
METKPLASEELIPVRALSNYIYCPRLFYLQHVEGVFIADKATAEGTALHRTVDTPTELPPGEAPPKTLRSLHLDSPTLGITGVIDICYENEGGIDIVDHKRGSARRDEHEERVVKEWDAVQVVAQSLLAEENGLKVRSASVFYAADRRRVPVELSVESKTRCIETIRSIRSSLDQGTIPPPLKRDWRCSYCSAYPVCLPAESERWSHGDDCSVEPLRPPMVEDDTREVLLVQTAGAYLGVNSGKAQVKVKGELQREIPLHLYGAVQMTAHFLAACLENGVHIGHFSAAGNFIGLTSPLGTSGTLARRGQYRIVEDEPASLRLAIQMIAAKIHNQRTLLLRNGEDVSDEVKSLAELKKKAGEATSLDSLRGYEGAAAAIYFSAFRKMLKPPNRDNFDFSGRNRRPPKDPVNALLSLGYSMLAKELTGICTAVGVDPFLGIYHRPKLGRPALALDLMEEFRPLLVDSTVITLFNRQDLQPADFEFTTKGVFLKDASRRIFWEAWFRRMDTEVLHPEFGYRMNYRRMLEVQVRQLWRVFCGEAPRYHGFITK